MGISFYFLVVTKMHFVHQHINMWFKRRSLTHFYLCLSIIWVGMSSIPANAQTEFKTLNDSDHLQQDYFQELDKWMLRAYEGNRDAQFKVGVLFSNEQFDQPKAEQAVYWYKQAARQGHILAQYNLGHHLLTGNGVEKDERAAIDWWKQAAQEDHALAQFNVGRAYYLGIGVEKDHNQSRYWFSRAAQNKEEKSIEVLQQLGWEIDLNSNGGIPSTSVADDTIAATSEVQSTDVENTEVESIETGSQQIIETEPEPETIATTGQQVISATLTDDLVQQTSSSSVALYTDPDIRSVLITILQDRDSLSVIDNNEDWVSVRNSSGFPIWVYSDYLKIESDNAIVLGNNVNARAVPLISKGTIVGKLNSGDKLTIIDQQNEWYRVTSPSSFTAWVKREDYYRSTENSDDANNLAGSSTSQQNSNTISADTAEKDDSIIIEDNSDNAWLFSQGKDSYTLQLASFDDEQLVNEFLSNSKLRDDVNLHRFTAASKEITWTYFLYGSYDSKSEAEKVQKSIEQNRAWVRRIGQLQENRCLSWKTKVPAPSELNQYCSQ